MNLRDALNGLDKAVQESKEDNTKMQIITLLKTIPESEKNQFAAKVICEILEDGVDVFSVTSHAIMGIYGEQRVYIAVLHDRDKWAVMESDSLEGAKALADDFSEFVQKGSGGELKPEVWVSPELN